MKQPNDTAKEKSPARVAAGQRNGRLGAGKKSPEGLAASAQNSLKYGFYSRNFSLLATESPVYFEKFREAILSELQPITAQQYRIAQAITHYSWLLERNFAMEVAAMDTEISSHKKQQSHSGEKAPNQTTAWLAFDSLVQRNGSLTTLYRQRAYIERQLARLRKEYAETIALRESLAYTAYIPPLPEPGNPMFEEIEEEELEEVKNEGNSSEESDQEVKAVEEAQSNTNHPPQGTGNAGLPRPVDLSPPIDTANNQE